MKKISTVARKQMQKALEPLLAGIESLSERIREYNEGIEQLAEQSYPQVARVRENRGEELYSCEANGVVGGGRRLLRAARL